MPIISSPESTQNYLNGEPSSLLLCSLDDEESFVVLERSTANDFGSVINTNYSSQAPQSVPVQHMSNDSSVVGPRNVSVIGESLHFPVQRDASEVVMVENLPPPLGITNQNENSNVSVSAEEIQKELQEVLRENVNLKENLYQTNLAMKQQLSTVSLLQDRASEVQKQHQAKFEETKALILKINSEKNELQETNSLISAELHKVINENKQLKESNNALGIEVKRIVAENDELKKTVQTLVENARRSSLQPTSKELELREALDHVNKKLESVERSRRQQEFDIDKLQAQLGRTLGELTEAQRRLTQAENALEIERQKPQEEPTDKNENPMNFLEKFVMYDELLKQLKGAMQEEQTRFESLRSWLSVEPAQTENRAQFEVLELRRLLAEEQSQSVTRKEHLAKAVLMMQQLLVEFRSLGEEFEKMKAAHAVKESHGLAYDDLQKKSFTERLDSVTAKLVEKEEALAMSERHLASLQEAVRLQNAEKTDKGQVSALEEKVETLTKEVADRDAILDTYSREVNTLRAEVRELHSVTETVAVLEEQAKIYQADFEAERKSRESLVAEKERLLDDLGHLQRRNQELLDTLSKAQNTPTAPPANARQDRSPTPPAPRPQDEPVPPPKRFYCPNPECTLVFTSVEPLQLHVITCLQLTD